VHQDPAELAGDAEDRAADGEQLVDEGGELALALELPEQVAGLAGVGGGDPVHDVAELAGLDEVEVVAEGLGELVGGEVGEQLGAGLEGVGEAGGVGEGVAGGGGVRRSRRRPRRRRRRRRRPGWRRGPRAARRARGS
jgi:hypothetical protein